MSSGASMPTASRVDRLLRSLVGVADVRLGWSPNAELRDVHLLKDAHVQHHQLMRNVLSGLKAAFGIEIDASRVRIHDDASALEMLPAASPAVSAPVPVPSADGAQAPAGAQPSASVPAAQPPIPAQNGHTPTAQLDVRGEVPVRAADVRRRGERGERAERSPTATAVEPILLRPLETELRLPPAPVVLDRIDVERHGPSVRCRVAISVGDLAYAAVADAADGPTAEGDLAARVTLDALRAGGLSAAALQGIGIITIADCTYVVATVRDGTNGIPRAGSVPLIDSMAWSAALAVLRAAGADAPMETRPVQVPLVRTHQLQRDM